MALCVHEISLLWLVRTGMSPTVSLCKLWKMFTSNSLSLLLVLVEIHPMPVQLSNQTKIQDSHADFYCSLYIFPLQRLDFLTQRLLCFAWTFSLGHNLESASQEETQSNWRASHFIHFLLKNTILSCCQMSYILSSYSVSYCGKASLSSSLS